MVDRPADLPANTSGLLGGGDLTARLERWLASARADEAAAGRSRERWLRQASEESATWAGVLTDLAEQRARVVVRGLGGRRHRGTIGGVGTDFLALHSDARGDTLLAYHGISSVQVEGAAADAVGDRDVAVTIGLAELLAGIADDRPRVLVVSRADAEGTVGVLISVGRDVIGVQLDGRDRQVAYVPIASIAELRLA